MSQSKLLLAVAFISGLALEAPRAVATDYDTWPSCDLDGWCTAGSGGGTSCASTDECCKCKAACAATNKNDRKTCSDNMDGAALVECNRIADAKKERCIVDCTINDKCQDA